MVKIGSVVLKKKVLTDDDGRQPIAICHPSDSGDLKNILQVQKRSSFSIVSRKFSLFSLYVYPA